MTIVSTSTSALTVAEYSARIVRALRTVGGGVVEGEVQEPARSRGGMLFFDLTDGCATLRCKVFPRQVAGLEHEAKHGDLVQVRIDRPDLFVNRGTLNVIVSEIRLAGEGELRRRRDELRAHLTAEGLCDPARRKPLPAFPRAVGVISGAHSKGLHDVIAALQDRFPPVHIIACTALVQGMRAPLDIVDALAHVDAHPLVDVIVIARGGGSVQDLVAFDDERVCRAVFACDTPVIAAIGHTDNIPVCNHVAWAKETPSRSPELAVPSAAELRQRLQLAGAQLAPLPRRVHMLSDSVAGITLDAAGVVRARRLEVSGAAGEVHDAEHEFFATREAGLARAREALAGVLGRIPDVTDIDALAGRLDTRAIAFFSERSEHVRKTADFIAPVRTELHGRAEAVREAAAGLVGVRTALETRAQLVAAAASVAQSVLRALDARRERTSEQDDRLTAGIRRELADHLRDYGRALARHTEDIPDGALRRLTAEQQRSGDAGTHLGTEGRRRLDEARRDLDHVMALLSASDPRRRGWVLPTTGVGAVVRSVDELAIGDRLTLSFHDGAAGAAIDTLPDKEQT